MDITCGCIICTNALLASRIILGFWPLKTWRRPGRLALLRWALLFDCLWTGSLLARWPGTSLLHSCLLGWVSTRKKTAHLFAGGLLLLLWGVVWTSLDLGAAGLLPGAAYLVAASLTAPAAGALPSGALGRS